MLRLANSVVDSSVLGSGLSFPLKEDPATGDFRRVTSGENLTQCMQGLIFSAIGERVMGEDIGSTASSVLFEPADAGTKDALQLSIREALSRYEGRVTRVNVQVFHEQGTTRQAVRITSVNRETGSAENRVYPFYRSPAESSLEKGF